MTKHYFTSAANRERKRKARNEKIKLKRKAKREQRLRELGLEQQKIDMINKISELLAAKV